MKQFVVDDFEGWRERAREILRLGVGPEAVYFVDARLGQSPLDMGGERGTDYGPAGVVPREFLTLAQTVSHARDADKWNLLYRVLWRLTHGEPHLLRVDIDDDIRQMRMIEKAIRRDMHKMRAFVRFRELAGEDGTEYVAWYRPDHLIVRANAPFFVRRFGAMRWAILTPDESAYWDGVELRFGPGLGRGDAPGGDPLEEMWRTYYASIFNPARTNLKAMRAEMPVRHWSTLPEAQIINNLLRDAGGRVSSMVKEQPGSAQAWIPAGASLEVLGEAVQACQGCDLYAAATQAVFGEGPSNARVVMVGEQPGDQEDLAGRPFCGPAGQLLDRAMKEAGLDRSSIYVTNAVKHFKFEERGKRRLHKKPDGVEVSACRPWLEAEIHAVQPELILCLGATAAQSLVGKEFRVTQDRGKFLEHRWAKHLMGTIHPSALLRMADPAQAAEGYRMFVRDLRMVVEYLGGESGSRGTHADQGVRPTN